MLGQLKCSDSESISEETGKAPTEELPIEKKSMYTVSHFDLDLKVNIRFLMTHEVVKVWGTFSEIA